MAKTITQKMRNSKQYKTHGENSLLIVKQISQKNNVYRYYSGKDAIDFKQQKLLQSNATEPRVKCYIQMCSTSICQLSRYRVEVGETQSRCTQKF